MLNGGDGGAELHHWGNAADDDLWAGGDGDLLFAQGSAGTVIRAGVGNETLQGIGSSGNDTFFAGPGNNLIGLGSGQSAVVWGGSGERDGGERGWGAGVFAFTNGSAGGSESIIGFKVGTDVLSLQGYADGEVGTGVGERGVDGGDGDVGSGDDADAFGQHADHVPGVWERGWAGVWVREGFGLLTGY